MDKVDLSGVVLSSFVFPFLFLSSLSRLHRVFIHGGLTDFLTRFALRRAFQWSGYSSFILLFWAMPRSSCDVRRLKRLRTPLGIAVRHNLLWVLCLLMY